MPDQMLEICSDLRLPVDAVTETFLIFGKRGSGKTSTASVFAEELIGAGLPACVIDPMGAWWGLRSSADGKSPGLPVTILGGEHADLPLSPQAGTMVADLVVSERLPVVLDLFLMSKTQQRKFVTDFMERLFRKNREPLHLFVDEADRFAPQRGAGGEEARLLGAYEDIVLRGRKPGIGSTSITLRPAQLHSAIRSQVEVLIAMRLLGKLDVAAIDEWIRLHASDEDARELKASLPSLPTGDAWVWSPGWLETMQRVHVRPRRTFDSSATPKVGERLAVPRQFARLDASGLERMAALLSAGETDGTGPTAKGDGEAARLRRQVSDLTAALAEAQARPAERVEVPVIAPGDIAALEQAITGIRDVAAGLELALGRVGGSAAAPAPAPLVPARRAAPKPARREPPAAPLPDAPQLKAGAVRMLTALGRQHPVKVTRSQLATLGGVKKSGGTFGSYFSALRTSGLITEEGALVSITPAGMAVIGVEPGAAVTVDEVRDQWRSALKAGARTMLDHLLAIYPASATRAELAEAAGIEQSGGTFGSYLSALRSNGLAEVDGSQVRAAEVFFLAGRSDA